MKAMILAAGRGERLRPLTDTIPKPLLNVHGQPLIAYHLQALAKIGARDVVINTAYLAEKIQQTLGDGSAYGLQIHYSYEPQVLETGGGILKALPLLGPEPFLVINGDVWTDYPLANLIQPLQGLAHLVLVPNPLHNQQGDYSLVQGLVSLQGDTKYTFAGIGIYHPDLFANSPGEIFRLPNVLEPAITKEQVSGELYTGIWTDVGTVERLAEVQAFLK